MSYLILGSILSDPAMVYFTDRAIYNTLDTFATK